LLYSGSAFRGEEREGLGALALDKMCIEGRAAEMCEANAYLIKDGKEELIAESVDVLRPEGDEVYIQNIFGEQRWVKAHIKEMNLVNHRILLVED
jgi:predicted RNA-binding protein